METPNCVYQLDAVATEAERLVGGVLLAHLLFAIWL